MGKSIEFRSFLDDGGDVVRFSRVRFKACIDEFIEAQSQKIKKDIQRIGFMKMLAKNSHIHRMR